MTFKRHWLLSWGGTLAGNKDIWANNVRFTNDEAGQPDSVPGSTLEGMLDDFVTDIRTFMRTTGVFISAEVQCQWVKFNEIGPDGRYVDQSTTHARYLTGSSGNFAVINGISTNKAPPYQSVCVTTKTAKQRGPGSKGRLFIPQCAPTLLSDGLIDPAAQTSIATAAALFYSQLGDEAGVDVTAMRPAVVSNVGSPGPTEVITSVAVGNVPDIISRRKNALTETYVNANLS